MLVTVGVESGASCRVCVDCQGGRCLSCVMCTRRAFSSFWVEFVSTCVVRGRLVGRVLSLYCGDPCLDVYWVCAFM